MYCQSEFEFKNHLKLDVHGEIHADVEGHQVVTLEGEEVCLAGWRHIMGVPEITFYRYSEYAAQFQLAQKHGNSSLFKPEKHTMQATVTLRTIGQALWHLEALHTRVLFSGKCKIV
jgi:hypothetical protein